MTTTRHIDLAGTWRLRPDPDDKGVRERWFESDWTDGVEAHVPAAWQLALGDDVPPVVWYRQRVRIPDEWRGSRIWLTFESVATDCRAWADGREIGRHVGDYVPFRFEITETAGEVDLTIRVDRIAAIKPDPDHWLQGGHITKGFHDVLSLAHGGIWQPVRLERTGPGWFEREDLSIKADGATGQVEIDLSVDVVGEMACRILDPDGLLVAKASGDTEGSLTLQVDQPRLWSPDRPALYTCEVELRCAGEVSDAATVRFGFRSIQVDGTRILLNGEPIFLSGVLDWGHEPAHGAPAPTPDEVRARFERLRAMGFNCVCLCMWYAPRYLYDIADETGMLIWQEHPIWQSDMRQELIGEYSRLCARFMGRDQHHPSVIIVSATCEHPDFNPILAGFWWHTAQHLLSDKLLQVQTASFAWADHERTDLHDEHTYEDAPRWVTYVQDLQGELQAHTRAGRERPFVMGESVLYTSWPDTRAIRDRVGDARPWWLPKGFDAACAFEDRLRRDEGDEVADRFMRQGDRFALAGRAFQLERFREYANHAGLVQNHLRDVPACRCGFLDDLDRWRFDPGDTRRWLAPAILTLATPQHARAFTGGECIDCTLSVSNFSSSDIDAEPKLRATGDADVSTVPNVRCPRGQVHGVSFRVDLPASSAPAHHEIAASLEGAEPNAWKLWSLPRADLSDDVLARTRCLHAPPIDPESIRLDVERGYSKGFGLPAPSAPFKPPNAPDACPSLLSIIEPDAGVRTILTHRLTPALVDHLQRGGHVIMLCSNAPGGVGSVAEWHFGSVTLVFERGPLGRGDSDWIIDCLLVDLIATWCRAIPSEQLGIADDVEPIVRQVFTHDQDRPVMLDLLAAARVGEGTLVLSSLDHTTTAGRYLLTRVIRWLDGSPKTFGQLDPARVRAWI